MNSFQLKWIAIITMAIDHIAAVLVAPGSTTWWIMRGIGRLAFPIFVFLLVQGFLHTRSVNKYLLRLAAFALISEVPFDLAFYGKVLEFSHQNIFFTLFLGLLAIYLVNMTEKALAENLILQSFLSGLAVLVLSFLAALLRTDYDYRGVLLIVGFYLFRRNKILMGVALAFVVVILFGSIESIALLSIIPIAFYNGEKGKSMKYFFYIFYPAHLLLLAAIHILI